MFSDLPGGENSGQEMRYTRYPRDAKKIQRNSRKIIYIQRVDFPHPIYFTVGIKNKVTAPVRGSVGDDFTLASVHDGGFRNCSNSSAHFPNIFSIYGAKSMYRSVEISKTSVSPA